MKWQAVVDKLFLFSNPPGVKRGDKQRPRQMVDANIPFPSPFHNAISQPCLMAQTSRFHLPIADFKAISLLVASRCRHFIGFGPLIGMISSLSTVPIIN
jgi:hypothetical protein